MPRYARADFEIDGSPIHTGDLVLLDMGAANHDPVIFPDSDRADIGRKSVPHVTFGYGAKFPAKYQEALYICRHCSLHRSGVTVKIFEESTCDPHATAARLRAVSLIAEMSPELFSSCRMFRVLHMNLLVKKRTVRPRYNPKYVAWKLAAVDARPASFALRDASD